MASDVQNPTDASSVGRIEWERLARAMLAAAQETQDCDGYTVAAEVRAVWRAYVESAAKEAGK